MAGGTASQLMKVSGAFDFIFVDEAGQVTLELLAVLASLARNLVLAPWRELTEYAAFRNQESHEVCLETCNHAMKENRGGKGWHMG